MTCERHYTPASITALQQITASIEDERRRQYRAEMAQELKERIAKSKAAISPRDYAAAYYAVKYAEFSGWLDELSPPVVCDEAE